MTVTAITQTDSQEKKLLAEWFETVRFDVESEGIPPLEDEVDDEGRNLYVPKSEERENSGVSKVDFEELMAELRKRDPDNPF